MAACSASACAITHTCLGAGSLPYTCSPIAHSLALPAQLGDTGTHAVCRLQARLQRQHQLLRRRPRRRTRACRGARCTSWHQDRGCSPAARSLCTSSRWAASCLCAMLCFLDSELFLSAIECSSCPSSAQHHRCTHRRPVSGYHKIEGTSVCS